MDTPREQRRYSDAEQAEALAALAANNGDIRGTARQIGIPFRTLANWAQGIRRPRDPELVRQKRDELRHGVAKLTRRVLKKVLAVAADPDEKVSLRDGMVSLGICIDKGLALDQADDTPSAPEDDERLALFRKHFAQAQVIAQELHIHLPPATPTAAPAPVNVTESARNAETPEKQGG